MRKAYFEHSGLIADSLTSLDELASRVLAGAHAVSVVRQHTLPGQASGSGWNF